MPTSTTVRQPTKRQREKSGLVFKEPPVRAKRGRPAQWINRLTPLMDFPGEWVLVRECPSHGAAQVTQSNLQRGKTMIPEGTWEFDYDYDGAVYARYLGT